MEPNTISSLQNNITLTPTTSNASESALTLTTSNMSETALTQTTFNSSMLDNLLLEPVYDDYNESENWNERTSAIIRSKIAAVRDYIIEQSDGSKICKICRARFGKKTATSTITRHFDVKHHSTYLAINQRVLDIKRFQPYGRKDQVKIDDINNKLTHWIVADQMLFILMDSGWFKSFIHSLNERYTLLCRQIIAKQRFKEIKTITDILVTKHQNLQDIYLTYAERNILQ
ncbi:12940_t:CDS:2, partial [Ambispora gerdemannii]